VKLKIMIMMQTSALPTQEILKILKYINIEINIYF